MMRVPLRVVYADGTTADVTATQYALARYAAHCQATGVRPPAMTPDDTGTVQLEHIGQLRYMAYAELRRHAPDTLPDYDEWDVTVDEVVGGDAETVDPTLPAVSAVS